MKRKILSVLFALVLVLSFSLVTAVPAAAANPTTIASSTMVFQSVEGYSLDYDSGTGTYSGMIPMAQDESTFGDGIAGFDLYAKEDATYYVNTNSLEVDTISEHDWTTWDPDTPDWDGYSLRFYEEGGVQKWRVANHSGTSGTPWYLGGGSGSVEQGVPMSGTMDWTGMYAAETDAGEYLPPIDPDTHPKHPHWAVTYGGGPACWDMDWSWGSEVVPLQYPGFSVNIESVDGGGYIVTLTPALPSCGFVTGGGWIDSPPGAYQAPAIWGPVWEQGFEVDTDGWFDYPGPVVRVSSDTHGITSASGDWHAEVTTDYTQWGGYSNSFPLGGYITSLDIYLDVDDGFVNDSRFDFTSAISAPDGSHRRDFIFNGGFYNDNDGPGADQNRFVFSASNNAPGWPKNPGRDPIAITSSGWYTFQHWFRDDASGVLAVDMSIFDSTGNLVHKWTLSDPTDVIGATVGGNRYGWFATSDFPFLAIDNSFRAESLLTGKATFGFVAKYKKGASLPDGQTQFMFQTAGLNFHSNSYEWLVIAGDNARFKGMGTLNGEDGYSFMLWAGDNDPDTFRIKIWKDDTVIYDNGMNQLIEGGNILVHKAKK